jgi:hypothetical protein
MKNNILSVMALVVGIIFIFVGCSENVKEKERKSRVEKILKQRKTAEKIIETAKEKTMNLFKEKYNISSTSIKSDFLIELQDQLIGDKKLNLIEVFLWDIYRKKESIIFKFGLLDKTINFILGRSLALMNRDPEFIYYLKCGKIAEREFAPLKPPYDLNINSKFVVVAKIDKVSKSSYLYSDPQEESGLKPEIEETEKINLVGSCVDFKLIDKNIPKTGLSVADKLLLMKQKLGN